MALMNSAYGAFRGTEVKTASQGKLVVLLYQGAVKVLKEALSYFGSDGQIAAPKIEPYGKAIVKAQDIINELQVSLDMEKGGQISQNLMSLYVYFNSELMSANINRDRKKVEFVLNMMMQLSEAWDQASRQTTVQPQTAQRALNINI